MGLRRGWGASLGFNPMAVNRIDSNAHGPRLADGAPAGSSRGGLQTIPATFAANHQPGTSTNIYDPVANIAAAMNYLMRRYHVQRDGSNLSAVGQFNPSSRTARVLMDVAVLGGLHVWLCSERPIGDAGRSAFGGDIAMVCAADC